MIRKRLDKTAFFAFFLKGRANIPQPSAFFSALSRDWMHETSASGRDQFDLLIGFALHEPHQK
ncbi:hypothetical protein GCD22_01670 [Acidithiobacillus thiooxidans ATCC 19377]|uniref:Uncharacterized protein n=1 Tax=Acidithiobacillus thiooxidans ATCC 19377 TaxID=637390 RepID=A0A5P9XS13_ACITH|nr:hypothetical protein GCD22_01670 [Acidithiobacillus thiooxidans ATCC 19377]